MKTSTTRKRNLSTETNAAKELTVLLQAEEIHGASVLKSYSITDCNNCSAIESSQ